MFITSNKFSCIFFKATPSDWNSESLEFCLPKDFQVWSHFFQPLISKRAEELVCRRIESNLQTIFEKISKDINSWKEMEEDLRSYVWSESSDDIGKEAGSHEGLRMKTKGFCPRIVELCHTLDQTYFDLLQDVSLYLHGTNGTNNKSGTNQDVKQLIYYLKEESSSSIDK